MRYLSIVLAVAAIAAASSLDVFWNYDAGGIAKAWAPVIEEGVPLEIGPWEGEDLNIEDRTLEVAGAVGKVSRQYTNRETGEVVDLWLICGHMEAIARHAPTVCYPHAGFKQEESQNHYTFPAEGPAEQNEFWTAWFLKERPGEQTQRRRVFWAWTQPKVGEPVAWTAPRDARHLYPGSKALFKMYFTTTEPEDRLSLSDNPSNDLARRLLPVLTELFKAGPEGFKAVADAASPEPGDEGLRDEGPDASLGTTDSSGPEA